MDDEKIDPIRLETLRLAVQMSTAGKLGPVIEIAREFEKYLRGEEPDASEPAPDPEYDCLCHHSKRCHLNPDGNGWDGCCRVDMCSCTERYPW